MYVTVLVPAVNNRGNGSLGRVVSLKTSGEVEIVDIYDAEASVKYGSS